MENIADLKNKIVGLGQSGNEQDPYLTAFIKHYGKCGEIYPEDDWLQKCGTFVCGWNSAEQGKLFEILLLFEQRNIRYMANKDVICAICGERSDWAFAMYHHDHCPLSILESIRAKKSA